MNYKRFLYSQIINDTRAIKRDPLLKYMIFMPIFLSLFMRWLIPILQQSLQSNGIDITDYYDLILSYFFLLMCPMVYGMIVGFTLLDERDEMTLFAIQVSPLNMRTYLLYKLVVPVILSFISILI
ncbi:MAG: ABC transporter permease, partial [Candidatus Heimdallarchaeota archaeon]|nr:ABC transporter permease [Candidatus Heimdallarchaeota archaeon]